MGTAVCHVQSVQCTYSFEMMRTGRGRKLFYKNIYKYIIYIGNVYLLDPERFGCVGVSDGVSFHSRSF